MSVVDSRNIRSWQDFDGLIRAAWGHGVRSFLEVGHLLIAAKDDLPHGVFEAMQLKLPFMTLALAGSHGGRLKQLVDFLERMTLQFAPALIERTRERRTTNADTCFFVLRLIDNAIVELRERHHLPPFDDALPGEPSTVFQIIREKLS